MKDDPRSSSPTPGLSRRTLLGASTSLAAAAALSGSARAARGAGDKPVLVQVFLRTGMDGLTTVVPHGDADLYRLRPRLAIRPPGQTNGALDLDGFFGLAPAAAPLLTPFGDGHLAIVHASGSIDPTRSHFEAFERMEYADPRVPTGAIHSGWATRYLLHTAAGAQGSLRGIGVGANLPLTLRQAPSTLPVLEFAASFPGPPGTAAQRQDALLDAYATRSPVLHATALNALEALHVGGVDYDAYQPEHGAQYPDSLFGARLRNVAALIKQEAGIEVVTLDYGGWDLHARLGPIDGRMAALLDDLTRGLEAFYLDMLGHLDDYLLVCLSEFGRHARENGSDGVDHGHGNAMFVLGDVAGGRVLADWPGLSDAALDQGDLAITIDYRDVLGELLVERLGVTDLAAIFPQHTLTPHGVLA
ncbi:MAG TPA: DUF1501 domain-containing protein [Planctomycetota bacterium]